MVVLKGVSAHVGANEKYKGGILKYVPCILKYVRPFFLGVFRGSVKCGQTRRVRASFDVRAGLLSVFFRVVFRCPPAGVCFFCFSCKFFACVYVFVFQGCAVREAGVLCVGGIKKFEKSHGKVWLFGLSVVLLHSLSGTKRRRKAEPGGGSSMIGLHKR